MLSFNLYDGSTEDNWKKTAQPWVIGGPARSWPGSWLRDLWIVYRFLEEEKRGALLERYWEDVWVNLGGLFLV